MRICPLLVALLLYGAVVAQSASFRAAHSDVSQYERCVINRRQIMETARRYYKAQFETKLLIYKIRLYRQQLLEKRLRYLNFLQRMKLRHNARIQRQVRRFQRQVNKVKVAYRKRLRSVTKRYQRRVIRKLKAKPLSNRRIRLIKKAFFRRGIISKRAAASAERAIRSRVVCISCKHARRRLARHRYTVRRPTQRRSIRHASLKVPSKKLKLHAKTSISEKIRRFDYLRHRFDRDINRALNLRMRKNKFQFRRRLLKLRIVHLKDRKRILTSRIGAAKLKRHELTRILLLNGTLGEARKRVARRISAYRKRVHDLQKSRQRLQHRIARSTVRRKRLRKRIHALHQRMKRQLRDSKMLFIRATKYITRWRATDLKIIGKTGSKIKSINVRSLHHRVQQPTLVLKTLTRSKIRRIMHNLRRFHRPDSVYFRETLVYRRRMQRIRKTLTRTKRQIAKIRKSELKLRASSKAIHKKVDHIRLLRIREKTKFKLQARLEHDLRTLQAKSARVKVNFAKNLHTWTSYVIKIGFPEYVKVLSKAVREGGKVKRRQIKRQKKQLRIRKQAALQKKLIKKLSRLGVSPRHLTRIIRQKQVQNQRAQLKKFAKRAAKRVLHFQRKLKRAAKQAAIIAQRRLHVRKIRHRLKRRIRRLRARRHRIGRRIQAIESKSWRLNGQVKRLFAWQVATQKQLNAKYIGRVRATQIGSKLAYIQSKIKRTVYKRALCRSRLITLRRRRGQIKLRILKITKKRQRLVRRQVAVKRRLKRKLNRLKKLVQRKRKFVRRVVKNQLVSRRVIRRVSKQSRHIIKHFLNRHIAKKVIRSVKHRHYHSISGIRRSVAKLDKIQMVTSRVRYTRHAHSLSLPKSKDLRLRRKKTVKEHIARFTEWRHRIIRDLRKGLSLRLRNSRFQERRNRAKLRIQNLTRRQLVLNQQIAFITVKRAELLRRLTQKKLHGPRLWVSKGAVNTISKYNKSIKVLLKKRRDLKRRILRTTVRRKRIQRRVRVVRRRMQGQLQETRRLFIRSFKYLTRWGATSPEVFQQALRANNARLAKLIQSGKKASIEKPFTRRRIRTIIRSTRRHHRLEEQYLRRILQHQKALSEIKRKISVQRRKLAKHQQKLVSAELRITTSHTHKDVKWVQKHETRLNNLQSRKTVLTKQDAQLKSKAAKLQSRISYLRRKLATSFRTWTSNLIKLGLHEHFQVLLKAPNVTAKVRNRILKRRQRRIADKRLALKQKKLVKKLRVVIGVSKSKLRHIVSRLETRRRRAQLKRFTKRVVKRVTRIQQKLTRAAKKAAIVARHKLHLKRLQTRLRRRIHRIRSRRHRLKRRIRVFQNQRTRLISQVRRLTARKLALQRQLVGRYTSIPVRNRVRSTVVALEFRTKRSILKISSLGTRINGLTNRRVLMKVQISKLLRRRHRYSRRVTAVKRRMRRQAKRIEILVRRKRRFVSRVVKKKLISPLVIRRVSKPSRRLIRRYVSRRLFKKIVKRTHFLKAKHLTHKTHGWFRKSVIRHSRRVRIKSSGRIASTVRKARKLLSKVAKLSSLHIRQKKPLAKNLKRFAGFRHRFVRDIRRTLTLHLRNNRFRRRRQLLKLRIRQLNNRKLVLKRRIIVTKDKCERLVQRWKWLQQRRKHTLRSGEYSGIKLELRRIERPISKCDRKIRTLQNRSLRLKRRVARTTARRHRFLRRIRVVRKRRQQELQDSRRVFLHAINKLTRLGGAFPGAFQKVAKLNKLRYAQYKQHHPNQEAAALKTLTRSKIIKIVNFVHQCHRDDARDVKNIIVNKRRITRTKRSVSKTIRRISILRKKLFVVQHKLESSFKHTGNKLHAVPSLEASQQSLKVQIENKAKELAIQNLKIRNLQTKVSNLKNTYVEHLHKWTWYLMEIGLPEYVQVVTDATRTSAKVRRHAVKRRLRRIRHQKEIARQWKQVKKLSRTIEQSKRKLNHIIKRKIFRRYRALRKRFAKRVVKRVTRIQRKLTRAAKKAAIVARHKVHLKRLRLRLKRRILRMRERRHRLKRRIRVFKNRRTRLISQVRRLTARKLVLQRQFSGKPLGYQTASSLTYIDSRIKRAVHKIALCESRVLKLKRRRVSMKIRIRKATHRQRDTQRRVVAVRRRIKLNVIRIQRLARRERRFVSRVVKNKIVSPRIIQPILKRSLKIVRRHINSRIAGRKVKSSILERLWHTHRSISKRISKSRTIGSSSHVSAETGVVSAVRSGVSLFHDARRQLQKEKTKARRLLDGRKLPTITREIMNHPSRVVSRSTVSKVTRILGSNKLLKVTSTELVAKRKLQSIRPVPVRSLVRLQSSLRQKLRTLRRKLRTASHSFSNLVQRTKSEYAREESQVKEELTEQLVRTEATTTEVVHQQKLLHQTEYQTLVSTEKIVEDKGASATSTVVHTEESVAV